ncbi:MAG: hypothetical protein R3E65_02210 [Steroidobacteraceae bacterium]
MDHSHGQRATPGGFAGRARAARLLWPAVMLGLAAGAAPSAAVAATDPRFCAEAQRQVSGVTLPVRNVVHRSYESFVKSKPRVDPLETQQYSQPARGPGGVPARISCKMKTADHIRAVHGASAALVDDDRNACRELNRQTILTVWARLPAPIRASVAIPPNRFLLHADEVRLTGSSWTQPYNHVWADDAGQVHVRAKALMALWDDWRWKLAPDSFRGTHYCHLITPEYTRALMLGELRAPPLAPDRPDPPG